jgi:hypothetical protein
VLKRKALFTLMMFVFYGCGHKSGLRQTGDKNITFQLVNISQKGADNDVSYGARIIPAKGLQAANSRTAKENLMYRMDSCFYLQSGLTKVYPQLTQPVANGLKSTFEYLVTFDMPSFDENKWFFVYDDRYLDRKKYMLNLKD